MGLSPGDSHLNSRIKKFGSSGVRPLNHFLFASISFWAIPLAETWWVHDSNASRTLLKRSVRDSSMAFANRSSSFALEDRSTESEPAGTFRSLPERRVESLGCVPCARSTPTLLMFTRSILILESLPPSGTYRQGFI